MLKNKVYSNGIVVARRRDRKKYPCLSLVPRPLAQLRSASAIGAAGLGFQSRVGEIGTVSPPLRRFFRAAYVAQALSRGDGPSTRYTFPRDAASKISILTSRSWTLRFGLNLNNERPLAI